MIREQILGSHRCLSKTHLMTGKHFKTKQKQKYVPGRIRKMDKVHFKKWSTLSRDLVVTEEIVELSCNNQSGEFT